MDINDVKQKILLNDLLNKIRFYKTLDEEILIVESNNFGMDIYYTEATKENSELFTKEDIVPKSSVKSLEGSCSLQSSLKFLEGTDYHLSIIGTIEINASIQKGRFLMFYPKKDNEDFDYFIGRIESYGREVEVNLYEGGGKMSNSIRFLNLSEFYLIEIPDHIVNSILFKKIKFEL